jgi:hypothetical protein
VAYESAQLPGWVRSTIEQTTTSALAKRLLDPVRLAALSAAQRQTFSATAC